VFDTGMTKTCPTLDAALCLPSIHPTPTLRRSQTGLLPAWLAQRFSAQRFSAQRLLVPRLLAQRLCAALVMPLLCLVLVLGTMVLQSHPAGAVALGGDDRQAIQRIKGSAFGPVGLMVLDEGDDDAVAGTAFLVSPCHVLTAYHVAGGGKEVNAKAVAHFYLGQGNIGPDFDDARQFAEETTAHPVVWGQYVPNDDDSPPEVRAKSMLQNGWEDWTLLKLDRCLGDEKTGYGYFHLAPMTTRDLARKGDGLRISSIGLPGDKPLNRLWWDPHCRAVGQVHDSGWQNDCVTVPGNSGGPLLLRPDGVEAVGTLPPQKRPPVVGITIAIIGVDGLENDQSDRLALAKNDPNYYDLLGTGVPISAVIDKIAPYLPADPAVSAFLAAHHGDEHYTADKAELAVGDISDALKSWPHSAELYLLRASWEDVQGDADAALDDYTQAVAVDPGYAPARYLYGRALLQRGDDDPANLQGAIDAFTRLLKDFPRSPDVLLYRAFAYRAQKQNDKAIADLTATLSAQPGSAVAVSARGEAYRDNHEDDLALADFSKAIALNPQSGDILRDRGFLYHAMARVDLARADFKRALEIDKTDVEAANGLALCDLSGGHPELAIDSFTTVIKMAPDVGVYYANRGTAYLLSGDAAKATEDFRKGLQLEPDEPFDALLLYIAEARGGDRAKAKQELADFAAKWTGPKADGNTSSSNVETDWPRPMIDFYLGKLSAADVAVAAKRGDQDAQTDQHFDLDFYLGQWALLDGNQDEGLRRLQQVVKTDMREFMEFDIAQGDVDRLTR
jgi:lipoprotein NlpI/V8-like Glu-specific endopeptidase